MYKIILIATAHKDRGNYNSDELLKIIEQIAPEVIFEEIPSSKFFAIYEDGTRADSLETETIKRYLQNHPIAHLPIDLDMDELVEKRVRSDIEKMFNTFDQYTEIQFISSRHEELTQQFGFPYLNSEQCRELLERRHFVEEDIVRMFNHEKFSETHTGWLDILDKRENEMIKKIYSYSSINNYKRALFLVGAEHRKPIMEKILKFENNHKTKLDWDFNYFNK